MKLEAGMYVRLKNGEIDKILHIDYADERKKKYPTHPSKNHWRDNFLLEHKKYKITSQNIIKASHNIIDLIEVGDYVNGYKVVSKGILSSESNNVYLEILTKDLRNFWNNKIFKQDIKTILTKEQFENNCYKIGD